MASNHGRRQDSSWTVAPSEEEEEEEEEEEGGGGGGGSGSVISVEFHKKLSNYQLLKRDPCW
jgi:hypothetical protein